MSPLPADDSHRTEEEDQLILVDAADRELGFLGKEACHDGTGVLHRAFSVLLRDESGRHLIQRRSDSKRLWPGYWSNSCCSHPRRGESTIDAAHRRVGEELGLRARLKFVYRFQYHASFGAAGSENELCSVFVGEITNANELATDPEEIAEVAWCTTAQLHAELTDSAETFTPWFRQEWQRLYDEPSLLDASDLALWKADWNR